MEIENHKEEVPFAFYEEKFRSLNPEDAAARLESVRWDGKEFTLRLLGRDFAIAHPEYAIRALDCGAIPPLPAQTFLLRYLLESRDVRWGGEWKTFREMPWGEMYIKPYTGRVLTRAAFTFGTRVAAFRTAAGKWGGCPSITATRASSSILWAATECGFWCGRETTSFRPTPKCCIPTTLPRALPRKTGWSRGIS